MKKTFLIIAGLIILICFVGCSNNDKQDFYGVYTFNQVSYLSPLSSLTVDFLNKQMEGTKYTIKADLFKIETDRMDNSIEISNPNYVKEEIQKDVSPLFDIRSFIGNEVAYQYTIGTTHMRLYVSSDCLQIASYADNTANGSEIIMYIYKLSKISE